MTQNCNEDNCSVFFLKAGLLIDAYKKLLFYGGVTGTLVTAPVTFQSSVYNWSTCI